MKKTLVFLMIIISSALLHAQSSFEMTHINQLTAPGKTEQVVLKLHFYGNLLATYYVQQFTFNTNGTTNTSDILSAKLYTSDYLPVFANQSQYGSTVYSPDNTFSFYGNTMVFGGHSYFWLVFDVAPGAQINNFIDAECTNIIISMLPPIVPSPPSPAGNMKIINPVSGTFTVGQGGSYLNLTQAFTSLSNAVVGEGIIFEMLNSYSSAAETFPVNIGHINGTSAQSPVIIRPHSASDTILISSANAVTLNFNNASHIVFDGRPGGSGTQSKLKLSSSNYTDPAVYISNLSHNISFRNSLISSRNTYTGTIVLKSGLLGGVYNNEFLNCSMVHNDDQPPMTAVYSYADSGFSNHNTVIRNCIIKNFGNTGLEFKQNSGNTAIEGCEIYQDTSMFLGYSAPVAGIRLDNAIGDFYITGNRIHSIYSSVLAVYTGSGIKISGTTSEELLNVYVYNNFISMGHFSWVEANFYGIDYISGPYTSVYLYNNSIWIGGSASFPVSSSCISKTGGALLFNMKNNVLINTRNIPSGGLQYAVALTNILGVSNSDYNNFYSQSGPTGNNVLGLWSTTPINSISAWKLITGRDIHSVSKPVTFTSQQDLHLSGSSLGDYDLAGIFLPETSSDIDGDPRPLQFPYMGADENPAYPLPVELISFTAETLPEGIYLKWTTASELNNKGFEIERSYENNKWETAGFVNGSGNTSGNTYYSFLDPSPPYGSYQYRLKQIDMNGSFSYSASASVTYGPVLSYKLNQNYPNPFNPATVISYEIPNAELVQVKVYDILGSEILTLVNELQQPGRYNVTFNAKGLSTGVYFYEIRTVNFSLLKKMVYLQ